MASLGIDRDVSTLGNRMLRAIAIVGVLDLDESATGAPNGRYVRRRVRAPLSR